MFSSQVGITRVEKQRKIEVNVRTLMELEDVVLVLAGNESIPSLISGFTYPTVSHGLEVGEIPDIWPKCQK